jgi:hypothetical protein
MKPQEKECERKPHEKECERKPQVKESECYNESDKK